MIDPISLLIGGTAISAGSALYNAYKQGEINEEEYSRKKQMTEEYQRALESIGPGEVAPPVSLEMFQTLQQYAPQTAQFYEQQAPELITEANSGFEKGKQREALDQLSNLSQTGNDAISRAAQTESGFQASQAAQSRRAQILKEQAQRGLGGQGSDTLTQIAGGQQDDQTQYLADQRAAAEAQQRRLSAINSMGSLAGQIRGQNTATESQNRNIMNSFYQNMASAKNAYNQYSAGVANQAQAANISQNQNTANSNVGQTNQQAGLGRAVAQQKLDNEHKFKLSKADIAYNSGNGLAGLYANNARTNTQNYAGVGSALGGGLSSIGAGMAAQNANEKVVTPTNQAAVVPPTNQINLVDSPARTNDELLSLRRKNTKQIG